jgi:hypothetical protein
MADLHQRTFDSIRTVYHTAKQMQYAVHVLFRSPTEDTADKSAFIASIFDCRFVEAMSF